jgi:hypothetical protein
MEHALRSKPPGVVWFGQFFVPLADVVGSLQVALLLSIVICQAAVLALIYAAVRRLADGRALVALVAVLVTAGAPLFVSMSREYFAEPLQTLAVTWVLFIMVSATSWRPALTIAQLVAAVSLGLLAKVSTPLYMVAPVAVALFFAVANPRGRRRPVLRWDPKLVLSIALAGVLLFGVLAWYRTNLDPALDHARFAAESELYGTKDGFVAELSARLGRLEHSSFLAYFSLLLVPLALWAAVVAIRRGRALAGADLTSHRLLCHTACLATIGAVLTALALQTNDEVRFLLPLIPCFALMLGGLVNVIGSRRLTTLAVGVLCCQFILVSLQSFGSFAPKKLSYFRIRSPEQPALARELRAIVRLTCTEQAVGRISVVGVDYPWLNSDTLSMLADEQFALAGRQCQYTTLGYAESDPKAAWSRVRRIEPPYYIGIDYGNASNPLPQSLAEQILADDPFNRVNVTVFKSVLRSGRFVAVPGGRRSGIVVLRSCYKPISPFVQDFYRKVLERQPRSNELSHWATRLTQARSKGHERLLAAAQRLGSAVFGSAEYDNLNTSNARFLADLYAAYLGRSPDRRGYESWLRALSNGSSRRGVRAAFADGHEFRNVVRQLCAQPSKHEREPA